MRGPRIRNDREECFLHCFNRAAGWKEDEFFDDVDKERLYRLALDLQKFYSIEVISFVCMSNHWHAVVCTHPELPSRDEVERRFANFYGASRLTPNWGDAEVVKKYGERMRDVSCFVKDLQQRFTCWYNRTHQRRGRLWADRYKNVVLEGNHALWECLKYVEMNPVRAGYCADAADYRFCSWGRYCGSGRHPFAAAFHKHLANYHSDKGNDLSMEDVAGLLRTELARVAAAERGAGTEEIEDSQRKAASGVPFELCVTRRVRYWTDGAIIGSKDFVRNFSAAFFGEERTRHKRLARSSPDSVGDAPLYSFRQLRTMPSH